MNTHLVLIVTITQQKSQKMSRDTLTC